MYAAVAIITEAESNGTPSAEEKSFNRDVGFYDNCH